MTIEITRIILWACIAINIACIWMNQRATKRLRREYNAELESIHNYYEKRECRHRKADNLAEVSYTVRRCSFNDSSYMVVRCAFVDRFPYESIIKIFDDDDTEFNLREAQELCDKLNEK